MPRPCIKSRKSPSQARSAETVRVVVEAAARILEEAGLDGYTTNAVARRAGVSVGSLYQYFPNKDALTAALIDREMVLFLDDVAAHVNDGDGLEALDQLISCCVEHQFRRPALARLLDFEERRLPLHDQQAGVGEILAGRFRSVIERLVADEPYAIDLMALDLVALVRGMIDAAGERGERDKAHLHDRVVRAARGFLEHPR